MDDKISLLINHYIFIVDQPSVSIARGFVVLNSTPPHRIKKRESVSFGAQPKLDKVILADPTLHSVLVILFKLIKPSKKLFSEAPSEPHMKSHGNTPPHLRSLYIFTRKRKHTVYKAQDGILETKVSKIRQKQGQCTLQKAP